MKKAVITGISGQDGAYLSSLLLKEGYIVYGSYRGIDKQCFWRLKEIGIYDNPNLHLLKLNLTSLDDCTKILKDINPNEIYNLASDSFVPSSFNKPLNVININGLGLVNLLEAIRTVNDKIKIYQASSSEIFGKVKEVPQTEETSFCPRNPYGIAKLYAHLMAEYYRNFYDLFVVSNILYNHESPLRDKKYVTRKITDGAAKIKLGILDKLELGDLDAKRDWGFAGDYVRGMFLMMQADHSKTYISATQKLRSVREFVTISFKAAEIDIEWEGKNIGRNKKTDKIIISVNPKFLRKNDNNILLGCPKKAKDFLGWQAETSLENLCALMVKKDLERNYKK